MESLISDHLEVFLKDKKRGIPRMMDEFSVAMGWIVGGAIGSIMMMLGVQLLRIATRSYAFDPAKPDASVSDALFILGQKIDLLYSFIGGGRGTTIAVVSLVYFVASIALSVAAGLAIEEGASNRFPSFILFTQKDERQRDEALQRFQNGWRRTAFGFCLAVLSGVAANYFTYLLW